MSHRPRAQIEALLARADVEIDGSRAHDPQVHDPRFFSRVLAGGSLGLGESYVDGDWDCKRLDELVCRLQRARLDRDVRGRPSLWSWLRAKWCNAQSRSRAYDNAQRHYDLGHDLYEAMLDRRMIYTGARWRDGDDLESAQEHKLDWVARKLQLRPGMRVLDVGCGWGGTAKFLSERHGVSVVGITVSRDQAEHAARRCRGLPVEIRLQDYREVEGTFDRIVSLGMIEHVGARNHATYFEVIRERLVPGGIFVLQTIGSLDSDRGVDPWIEKYVFPNAQLPSASQLTRATEGRLVMEDWENLGADYDRTLLAWHANFERAWPRLRAHYGERFHRLWRFYLLACAGSFRARAIQLWQIAYSREGVVGGYVAPGRERVRPAPARRPQETFAARSASRPGLLDEGLLRRPDERQPWPDTTTPGIRR